MADNKVVKKEKNERTKCRWCNKNDGIIKYYIIADDKENPRPYHVACMEELEKMAKENIKKVRSKK